MERADALAEERAALTNYMKNTLITNELKFKEVRAVMQHRVTATAALQRPQYHFPNQGVWDPCYLDRHKSTECPAQAPLGPEPPIVDWFAMWYRCVVCLRLRS